MAINKNFVVKNGLEVNTNQIFADSATGKVGIGSTQPTVVLDVQGGIAATDVVTELLRVSGYATFSQVQVNNNINVSGISTVSSGFNVLGITSVTNLRVTGVSTFNENVIFDKDIRVTGFSTFVGVSTFNGSVSVGGIATFFNNIDVVGHTEVDNLNVSGFSTFASNVDINSFADISGNVRVGGLSTFVGVGTFQSDLYVGGDLYVTDDLVFDEFTARNGSITGVGTITNLDTSNLYVSGFATVSTLYANAGIITASLVDATDTDITNLAVSGLATVSTLGDVGEVVVVGSGNTLTNLGIATLSVAGLNVTGVLTATSFSGDGTNIDLTNNPRIGIGIGTTGGVVGYGITFIDFYGAGVSTSLYNSNAGIATIYFEGGGGGGSASIGIGSTPGDAFVGVITAGNLWYNSNLGRLFIYYQDDDAAQWVDAAPFNVGFITSLTGGVSFSDGTANSPSWYFVDDQTTGVFSPTNGQLTFVSIASSVLNINPGGINVTGFITASNATITGNVTVGGNVSIAGTLTYDDVTNIDSIGLVTARNGLQVTGGITTISGQANLSNTTITGVTTISNTVIPQESRFSVVAEKMTRVSASASIGVCTYSSDTANILYFDAPSADVVIRVTGIPTTSAFDNHSITVSAILRTTGTGRSCHTHVQLNGVERPIKFSGGSRNEATSGVTTTRGYTIYNFVGVNTIGSASTTANYEVFGIVSGGFF